MKTFFVALAFLLRLANAQAAPARISSVVGFLIARNQPTVAVKIEGLHSKWLQEGMSYEGNTIVAVDVPNAVVRVRDPSGKEYTLPLNISKIAPAPGLVPAPDGTKVAVALPHVTESKDQVSRRTETVVYDVYPPKGFKPRTDDLDFDWIGSDRNPMRVQPANPNGKDFLKWPTLTQAEKDAFIELYRQCGYDINVVTDNKGVGMLARRINPKK